MSIVESALKVGLKATGIQHDIDRSKRRKEQKAIRQATMTPQEKKIDSLERRNKWLEDEVASLKRRLRAHGEIP